MGFGDPFSSYPRLSLRSSDWTQLRESARMAKHLRWSTTFYHFMLAFTAATILVGCAFPAGSTAMAGALAGQAQSSQQALLKSPRGAVEIQTGGVWSPLPTNGKSMFLESGQHVRTG